MFSNIKAVLKNNDRLYSAYKALRAPNGTPLHQVIAGYCGKSEDDIVIHFHKYGEMNPNKKFMIIGNATEYAVGFWGMVNMAMIELEFARFYNLTPYIYWKDCVYSEREPVDGKTNVFEYYYTSVLNVSLDEIMNSRYVFDMQGMNLGNITHFMHEHEIVSYVGRSKEVELEAKIYKKYFILNDGTKKYIDENIRRTLNGKKTLGVHARGGDFRIGYENHPKFGGFAQHVSIARKLMEQNKYERVFLATDDEEAIQLFQKEFGEQLVYYSDVERAVGTVSAHVRKTDRPLDNYRKGLEVLRDAYTLAACDGIVSGYSNVATAARYIKLSNHETFDADETIDFGINRNGRVLK